MSESTRHPRKSGISQLWQYLRKYKFLVLGNVVSNVLTSIFSLFTIPLIIPLLDLLFSTGGAESVEFPKKLQSFDDYQQYLSAYFESMAGEYGHQQAIFYVCLFFAITMFLTNFFRYLSLYFMAPVRQGIVRDLRYNIFSKMMYLPLSYYSEERKGDLMSRVTSDVQEVEWSILNMLEAIFRNPIMIIGVLAFMIYSSPNMTAFVFVLLLVAIGLISTISRTLKRNSADAQSTLGYMVSIIEEGIGGLRIIKSFTAENFHLEKFAKSNQKYYDIIVRILRRRDMASPFSEFLGVCIALVLIYYGSSRVMAGEMGSSTFIAYLYAFFRLIEPAKALSNAYFNIQKGRAALDRLNQVIDSKSNITNSPGAVELSEFKHQILLDNVSFRYSPQLDQVVKSVNIEIQKGKTVAIVGESGSGKSTLVDLVPRFYDVTNGRISIDGMDIRNIRLGSLRDIFGIVSQEPILFNDTIINNIAFGQEVNIDRIQHASKMAYAHDFIMQTDQGYNTIIGDRGMKLSGGQRQRITIARALYKDPQVLIFDEATSALDTESEKLVQEALLNVTKNRTSIVIAHRLSTIQHADWIIVMDAGRIVEQGTHESLLSLNHHYAKLVRMQNV